MNFFRYPDREPSAFDDDLEDIRASGWFAQWVGGVILPLLAIAYGAACMLMGETPAFGKSLPMPLHAGNALAAGIAAISAGLFVHCHYFWGNIYHLSGWAVLGKIVSLLVFIGSLGYLIVRVGVLGR